MMQENGRRQTRSSVNLAALGQVIAMMALAVALSCGSAQANNKEKEKPEDYTTVYAFTYDEVFQAADKALMRLGWRVSSKDKDKGIIQGLVIDPNLSVMNYNKNQFELHVETVSSKPETKVVVLIKVHHFFLGNDASDRKICAQDLFTELQKVLATY